MSDTGTDSRTDQAGRGTVDHIQTRFLERVGIRLENGLSERELAEELIIEALGLTNCSYGFVLGITGHNQLTLEAVVTVDANGLVHKPSDTLSCQQPDELMLDIIETRKPAYINDTANSLTNNMPDNHPSVHAFALCPLTQQSSLKGILLVANPEQDFDVQLLGRLNSTLDALVRLHVNSILNRSVKRMIDVLGQTHRQLNIMTEAAINGVLTLDENATIVAFNPACERLFQLEASDAVSAPAHLFLPGQTLHDICQRAQRFQLESGNEYNRTWQVNNVQARTASGQPLIVTLTVFHTSNQDAVLTTLLVHEKHADPPSDLDLLNSRDDYHMLTQLMPAGVIKLNQQWLCINANEQWSQLTGLSTTASLEAGWVDAFHEDDRAALLQDIRHALINGHTYSEVLRLRDAKGETVRASINAASLTDYTLGELTGALLVIMDITKQHFAEQQLKQIAHHDPLTGLPNRSRFLEHLDRSLHSRQSPGVVALLFIDVDGFKAVNDTLGHAAGDALLQQVARRLKYTVRDEDTVARLGGDEFSVTLSHLDKGEDASIVADAIVYSLKQPFLIKQEEVYVSASIGIALASGNKPGSDFDTNTLIKQADVALYRAKLSGRSRHVFFTAELDQAQRDRSVLITSLRRAVDRQDFELFYQPQLLIREQQLLGFEALLRWPQAMGKHISPGVFIDVLEDTGLISELGEWAIGQACNQHRIWLNKGLIGPAITMSVNVSVRQLGMPYFADRVAAILQAHDMRPDSLILEITESALVETFETSIIKDIKKLGVQISLDDFGTGYSSLSYLSQLPLDHLKIDRSFIADIVRFPHAVTVIKSIIALANTLGIRVIAEGVEDASVLPLLADEGCECYQGFYFSQPLPASAMSARLREMDTVRLSHYANFIDLDSSIAS